MIIKQIEPTGKPAAHFRRCTAISQSDKMGYSINATIIDWAEFNKRLEEESFADLVDCWEDSDWFRTVSDWNTSRYEWCAIDLTVRQILSQSSEEFLDKWRPLFGTLVAGPSSGLVEEPLNKEEYSEEFFIAVCEDTASKLYEQLSSLNFEDLRGPYQAIDGDPETPFEDMLLGLQQWVDLFAKANSLKMGVLVYYG